MLGMAMLAVAITILARSRPGWAPTGVTIDSTDPNPE